MSLALLATLAMVACGDDAGPSKRPVVSAQDEPLLEPGAICETNYLPPIALRFDPPQVVVAPGQTRPVRVVVEPDVCVRKRLTFALAEGAGIDVPAPADVHLRRATHDILVTGRVVGTSTLKVTTQRRVVTDPASEAFGREVPFEDVAFGSQEESFEAALTVDVREDALPSCADGDRATATLDAAHPSLAGANGLATASMGTPVVAFTRTDEYRMPSVSASVACAPDLVARAPWDDPGTARLPLGPAVSFGVEGSAVVSASRPLRRELEFSIPVNPARMPSFARMRHVEVMFQSPMAKEPRSIPVTDPRFEKVGGGYVFKFSSPWLGTYQPVVAGDAGARKVRRKLTHRAVMGISMGGGGAASVGLRHHDRFDAILPLGGPSEWTWMLWFIENYLLGGFCPPGQTCERVPPNLYPIDEPFTHTMDFNHWFSSTGSGGNYFTRETYIQLFSDLSLMRGNINGGNSDPAIPFFAAGPKATDPWVRGTVDGVDCSLTLSPLGSAPDREEQARIQRECWASRCDPANAWIAPSGYYDDEYNPDGTEQVISFCDGRSGGDKPYQSSWAGPATGQRVPVSLALAVDRNRNGVRDEDEPVIRSGHEPYSDTGVDGLADEDEPGYDPITNPDPNQDDYDPQINPLGTERNGRWDPGEPFQDVGLDGVPNTRDKHVAGDPGEGDGAYTEAPGLAAFYEVDSRSILHRRAQAPGGPLDDAALRRLRFFVDGGVRDIFNFWTVARHLEGAIGSRRDASGRPLLPPAFYSGFDVLPGQQRGRIAEFDPSTILWQDIVAAPAVRYGDLDASQETIDLGDGMHVGTAEQIIARVQSAFAFASQQWPDAPRALVEKTSVAPASTTKNSLGIACEIVGTCRFDFTGPRSGRTGPVSIVLPPGYAHEAAVMADVRYPVLYVFHGYGQEPSDIEALGVLLNAVMNDPKRSSATRLGKFIVVYADGRCRVGRDGRPECVQGTFYFDSSRPAGPQMETWVDELIDYVDRNYRTMPATEIEVVE